MMLSKDLQEILEGVHYFLSESLTGEPLSGKLECLRRGLVMQLEALALSYPTLRIRARSSASLPYLAMDGQNRSESMSSGSSGTNSYSNSYSNSSSGDGMVLGRGGGDTLDPRHPNQQQQIQDEEYEDFQENNKDDIASVNDTTSLQDQSRDDADDKEDVDDVYMESVEAVSFSNVIATCDKHGVLSKKTKGLLRNLKTYHCVASSGMLYLFLKETDERQRKTIDLSGYTARMATGEDIRDQRKKDSAFEIVGPGKKTHTFIARTPRDKVEWLAALDRTIKSGRKSQSTFALDTLISSEETHRLSQPQILASSPLILPPKPAPQLQQEGKKDDAKPAEDDYYYHDVSADDKEEVYEEVGPEGLAGRVLAAGQSQTLPARTQPPPSWVMDPPDYDPVSPDDSPPPLPEGPPPLSARRPPGRPPLPTVLQDRVNKQASRPLPDAPSETTEGAEDPIGIYCEIEDDMLEAGRESYEQRLAEENEKNWNLTSNANKPRAVSSEGMPSDLQSLSSRMSSNSLVGSLSDEIFMNISENSSTHALPHKFSLRSSTPKTPPKLPPKGIPYPQAPDDDSEYKVPTSAIADTEYQIPSSNPVPTDTDDARERNSVGEISAPLPMQTYQVPPSQALVPIKPKCNDRKNSIVEEETKPLTSFFSGKEDTNPKNNLKALTRRFEMKSNSLPGEDAKEEKRAPNQGTSVKDMIARINQNKSQVEKDIKSKTREEPVRPLSSSKSASAVFQVTPQPQEAAPPAAEAESRFAKPALPPRPHNLANGATLVVKPRASEDNRNCDSASRSASDDDYYETPDDSSLESASQRNSQDMAKDSFGSGDTSSGEYYVAKFAFVATIDQALSFNRGDTILVHDVTSGTGWWRATLKGRTGLVPREYLKKKEQ